jgi:ADP-heptose:LPS heptosyltransferase
MRKKLGIILPGKIGDIIICLPIAKHYYDHGYDIYWPIYNELINNFNDYINYVKFIPTYSPDRITESFNLIKQHNCEVLDLSFTSPGSWHNENTKHYLSQKERSFDEFRYFLANVDFQKKWTLSIERKFEREEALYYNLVKKSRFCLIQKHSSDSKIEKDIDVSNYEGQIIEINPYSQSVFDWIGIIEKAERILLIESCFTNLIEQLKIKNNKQILVLKNDYYGETLIDGHPKGLPRFKNNWKIV